MNMKDKQNMEHYLACERLLSDTSQIINKIKSENIEIKSLSSYPQIIEILKNLNDDEKLEMLNFSAQNFLELFPRYRPVFIDIKQEIIETDNSAFRFSANDFEIILEAISNNIYAFGSIIFGLRLLGQNKLKIDIFEKFKFEYEGKSELLNLSKFIDKLKTLMESDT